MRSRLALGLLVAAVTLSGVRTARAQCGTKPSSCAACHDGARAPRATTAAWHEDHGFADLCASCHGGRPESDDVAQAHEGLVAPLGTEDRCSACHAASTDAFRARYRAAREGASRSNPVVHRPGPHGDPKRNLLLAFFMSALAIVGGFVVVRREKKRSP